jgi:uncharacterized coiled-coil protein SlyX
MRATAAALARQPPSQESDEAVAKLQADVDLAIEEMAAQETTINALTAEVAQRDFQLQQQDFEIRRLRAELDDARATSSPTQPEGSGPEAEFLDEVRHAYQTTFSRADRKAHPLVDIRVGRQFLASLDQFSDLYDKILRVCAEVGCKRASKIPGREVHRLRTGDGGGDPPRVRSSDGAKAFRCSVQSNTPQAARLHWWAKGNVIEFACVVKHDDMASPE